MKQLTLMKKTMFIIETGNDFSRLSERVRDMKTRYIKNHVIHTAGEFAKSLLRILTLTNIS
jgi:hypothetical protein